MRARALVHVTGPVDGGKTTFIERLLDAEVAFAVCVRCDRDTKLRTEQVSAPKNHAELRRYRKAGAAAVALYRFAEPNTDAFFMSSVMEDYSEAAFIEGDCPIEYVDLAVFVAPAPPLGESLLRRVARDRTSAHRAKIEQMEKALESPEAMARLLGDLSVPFAAMAMESPRVLESLRSSIEFDLSVLRVEDPPAPTKHWAITEAYAGIQHAQLIVVNVRSDADRGSGEALVEDVARLRKDDAVFRDVIGIRGHRIPVTAVVADLSDPKDAGLKKAVARAKRATKRTSM